MVKASACKPHGELGCYVLHACQSAHCCVYSVYILGPDNDVIGVSGYCPPQLSYLILRCGEISASFSTPVFLRQQNLGTNWEQQFFVSLLLGTCCNYLLRGDGRCCVNLLLQQVAVYDPSHRHCFFPLQLLFCVLCLTLGWTLVYPLGFLFISVVIMSFFGVRQR